MTWAWGNAIDADTDLQDVSLWNGLARAVNKRGLVSGVFGDQYGTVLPAAPPAVMAADRKLLKAHARPGSGIGAELLWDFGVSVAVMQRILGFALTSYFRDDLYPSGLSNTYLDDGPFSIPKTVPTDAKWDGSTMASAIGYPTIGGIHPALWRRRAPRRIYRLTATHSESYNNGFVYSGGYQWSFNGNGSGAAPLEPGDKAQLYNYPPTVGPPYLAPRAVPGDYRGVWEYEGSGVWHRAPPGSAADVLDSSRETFHKDWMPSGSFQPGDYFGRYLLSDVYEVAKRLKWTLTGAAPYDKDGDYFNYSQKSVTSQPSDAAALAALAAQAPTDIIYNVSNLGMYSRHSPGSADLRTAKFGFSADLGLYDGLARTVEWFAFPVKFGNNWNTFGVGGLTEDHWCKLNQLVSGAGAHAYTVAQSPVFIDFPNPTFGPGDGSGNGWYIPYPNGGRVYLLTLAKWDFADD